MYGSSPVIDRNVTGIVLNFCISDVTGVCSLAVNTPCVATFLYMIYDTGQWRRCITGVSFQFYVSEDE